MRSINWGGSNSTPLHTPIQTPSTIINPNSTGFGLSQTQTVPSCLPMPPFTLPIHTTGFPPYTQQYVQSTLNPYALHIYPHFTQNFVSTPQTQLSSIQHPISFIPPKNFTLQNTWYPLPITTPYKTPKLDFPKFNGKDPRGKLNKCEKFFQLNPTNDLRARVLCDVLHMENDADIWYRTVEREKTNVLWPEFCNMVCQRFSKIGYENVVGQFNKLTQKGKVKDYITQFDELRNYVMAEEGYHCESYYIDNFISGLKDDIAQYLYNQRPQTMQEARDMARGQEFFLTVLDKRYKTVNSSHKGNYTQASSTSSYTTNSAIIHPF